MKLKQDKFALIAGILFALSFVLLSAMFPMKVFSPGKADVQDILVAWLISAMPLFSLVSAIVCLFRLRGTPALVACVFGAVGCIARLALFGDLFFRSFASGYLIGVYLIGVCGYALAAVGYIGLAIAVKRAALTRWRQIAAVLTAVGAAVGQAVVCRFVWVANDLFNALASFFGKRAEVEAVAQKMQMEIVLTYFLPSLLLVAGVLFFVLWLTKREEAPEAAIEKPAAEKPALEPVEEC